MEFGNICCRIVQYKGKCLILDITADKTINADKKRKITADKKLNIATDTASNIDKRQNATVELSMVIKDQMIK